MSRRKTPDTVEALLVLYVLLFAAGAGIVGGFIGYELGKTGPPREVAAAQPTTEAGSATEAVSATTETTTATPAPASAAPAAAAGEPTTAAPTAAPTSTPGDVAVGEQVFAEAGCGSCHALAAAGATGAVGPNLDETKPSLARLVEIVKNGGAVMPAFADSLSESQIADLAAFVTQATAAGQPAESEGKPASEAKPASEGKPAGDEGEPPPASESPSASPSAGEQAFAEAGCGSCHALAAAGATGAVGPNLDETKPSFAQVASIVKNGGAVMPAFADSLSESQIADLAAFVAQATAAGQPAVSGPGGESGATATERVVRLVLNEGRLTSRLGVVPPGRTTFTVRNAGSVGYWFGVLRVERSSLKLLGKLTNVLPGQTRNLALALSSGTYLLACCTRPGQLGSGMFSTLEVRS